MSHLDKEFAVKGYLEWTGGFKLSWCSDQTDQALNTPHQEMDQDCRMLD